MFCLILFDFNAVKVFRDILLPIELPLRMIHAAMYSVRMDASDAGLSVSSEVIRYRDGDLLDTYFVV